MRHKSLFSFFLLSLLLPYPLRAQVADLAAHVRLKDSIVSRYNRGDFKGIYEFAGNDFRAEIKEQDFIAFMKRVNQAGPVQSSTLSEDLGEVKYFKLRMPRIDLELRLSASSAKQFNVFAINRLDPYDTNYVKAIRSDNPLKTSFDSAIDLSVRKHMRNKSVSGLSIGIVKNGKTYKYNYGETEKGKGQLPTSDTYYEIGSITKTFTGTLLAQAVLDKKAGLQDDIRRHLKDSFPNLQYKGQPIRLVHLANHTSGLPGLPADFFNQSPYNPMNPYINYSRQRWMQALHAVKLDTLPGTKHYYSNWGVSILGHILEQVYRDSYDELLARYITGPMKMKDTKLSLQEKDKNRLAAGHTDKGKPTPRWDLIAFVPAGGIVSTVNDMVTYINHNISKNLPAIKLAHQLTRGTYENGNGLGWFTSKTLSGYTKYQHTGGTGGYSTTLAVIPELKAGYVILTNNSIDLGNLSREVLHKLSKQ
ncbi:MAG TPA: serine hydrolase domain-containing protein [Chitinophagaceae bacterium]|nr:serine hydrolase domain-containing protein [Chitinophagaceae bacterium]